MSNSKGSHEPGQAVCRNIEHAVFLLILDTHFTWKLRKSTEWKSRKPMLWGRFRGTQGHSPSFKCVQVQCSSSLLAHTQHLGVCGEQAWGVQLSGSAVQRPFPSWERVDQPVSRQAWSPQEHAGGLPSAFPRTTIFSCHPSPRTKFNIWGYF